MLALSSSLSMAKDSPGNILHGYKLNPHELQLNCNQYNSHSFCIGTAATAAQANIPEAYMKMLGRWQSDAYQRYIETPPHELAKFSSVLASASDEVLHSS